MQNKKTKIVATMGPAISKQDILKKLIDNGLNILRVNFSHATFEEATSWVGMLNNINIENQSYIAWMADTKGPEIRVDKLENDSVFLEKNKIITIRNDHGIGDENSFSITYEDLYLCVSIESRILLDDGLIELEVVDIIDQNIKVKVLNSGYLKSKKGVNVPSTTLEMPYINEKDYLDIKFACENKASYIAASFVRRVEDIFELRDLCKKFNREDMQIIAKIENQEGVDNASDIISVSDGIMVARGDLGTELPMEEVPIIQMNLCEQCNRVGKPIIIATHMLDSMERNPRPTRAEVGDVARAVGDGADAVMLSGETAKGDYPVEAIAMMAKIASRIETTIDHVKILEKFIYDSSLNPYDGIGLSAVQLAAQIGAKAIFCFTETGATAQKISKYRPTCPIYALSKNEDCLYGLSLNWGVHSFKRSEYSSIETKYDIVKEEALRFGLKEGDYVVVTGGHPDGSEHTNFLKVLQIGLD